MTHRPTDQGGLRALLREALDPEVAPTPDPSRARFARLRPRGEAALRLEILAGDIAGPLRRAAAVLAVALVLAAVAVGPAVAHDLGVSGATGTIEGAVVDEAGLPLRDAEVRVLPSSDARLWWALRPLAVRSGADGVFRVPGVPSGFVSVRASAGGHAAQTVAEVEVRAGSMTEVAFALAATAAGPVTGYDVDRVDPTLRLQRTATVLGRVLDAVTGSPIAGARVFSFLEAGARGGSQTSAEDGSFTLAIGPGELFLGVAAPGRRGELSGPHRVQGGETLHLDVHLASRSTPDEPLVAPRQRVVERTPAPAATPMPTLRRLDPGTFGGGSWGHGGSWGGWRPASTPSWSPRR